jgi:ketosteroid isomerase-like protein
MSTESIRANQPEDCDTLLGKAVTEGNLEGALSLYEPGAAFVADPSQPPVSGDAAMREALNGFIVLKGTLNVNVRKKIESGDLALLYSEWTLSNGKGPDGSEVNLAGKGVEVVRRQADGSWKFVLDNPFPVE